MVRYKDYEREQVFSYLCFDLEFFLKERRSYLKCPIAQCPTEIKELERGLHINEFFADILSCHVDKTEMEIFYDDKEIQIGQFVIPKKIDDRNQKGRKTTCVVKKILSSENSSNGQNSQQPHTELSVIQPQDQNNNMQPPQSGLSTILTQDQYNCQLHAPQIQPTPSGIQPTHQQSQQILHHSVTSNVTAADQDLQLHHPNSMSNGASDCGSVLANVALDADTSCHPKKRKLSDDPGTTSELDLGSSVKGGAANDSFQHTPAKRMDGTEKPSHIISYEQLDRRIQTNISAIKYLQRCNILPKARKVTCPRGLIKCLYGYDATPNTCDISDCEESPRVILGILYCWSRQMSEKEIIETVGLQIGTEVSSCLVNRVSSYVHEACYWHVYNRNPTKKIGGLGKIVEVDTKMFGKQWILGAVCRETMEKWMVVVPETMQAIDIVKSKFVSKLQGHGRLIPQRLYHEDYHLDIQIKNSKLLLLMRGRGTCFVPTKELQNGQERKWPICSNSELCTHHRPLDDMRPFLGEYVRFENTKIECHDELCTSIPELESLAHIWTGHTLIINGHSDKISDFVSSILSSTIVLQCHTLKLNVRPHFDLSFFQYPALYTLSTVHFNGQPFSAYELVIFTQQKTAYPQSKVVFVVTVTHQLSDAINNIYEEFLKSTNPCRLKIIIRTPTTHLKQEYFRAENHRTGEALEMKFLTKAEVKMTFDVDEKIGLFAEALILDRHII
ncbi:hypothetical protein DdX_19910 [Ditylenchus destructor]|uniref:Uncharacterized protein n=1 Tax=Ditylenchus destructor TaxID=166010 RepID=A0AAD4QS35_9BILA|nr:hypothetical protein DdX_19910 [Ditylenchus destructor]